MSAPRPTKLHKVLHHASCATCVMSLRFHEIEGQHLAFYATDGRHVVGGTDGGKDGRSPRFYCTTHSGAVRTASEAYAQERDRCARALATLEKRLKMHAGAQAHDPDNWGFVGDLAHIAEMLERAAGGDA